MTYVKSSANNIQKSFAEMSDANAIKLALVSKKSHPHPVIR